MIFSDDILEQIEICLTTEESSIELAHRQQVIEDLFLELMKQCLNNFKHPIWVMAFKIYNELTDSNLPLNCRPCFYKVYRFHIDRIRKSRE